MSKLIEIPDDGIIRTPIMRDGDAIGERMMEICPKCGRIVGYNSWFGMFYCTFCGKMFKRRKD